MYRYFQQKDFCEKTKSNINLIGQISFFILKSKSNNDVCEKIDSILEKCFGMLPRFIVTGN